MRHRFMLTIVMLIMASVLAKAQNKIDDVVDRYSTSSSSKYTSAVERNPKTRSVVKVVKILEMSYCDITPFVNAFRTDEDGGDLSESRSGNDLVMTRTVKGRKQNRIYMLKADGYYNKYASSKMRVHCTVTIIVKYK